MNAIDALYHMGMPNQISKQFTNWKVILFKATPTERLLRLQDPITGQTKGWTNIDGTINETI